MGYHTTMFADDSTSDATAVGPLIRPSSIGKRLHASLIVLAGGEIGREYKLVGDEHVLGRSSPSTIRIQASSVSRKHARILRVCEGKNEHYELIDLKSRNGTYVNNVPVVSARLNHGDKVQLGEVVFKFALHDEMDAKFHENVHRLIHYNQLTGLLTLEAFMHRLRAAIRRSRHARPFTLAMTDLDGLKDVNDSYGHQAGQLVIREMGAMMRDTVRPQDSAGLYGGDEAILLFDHLRLERACELAERLRKRIETRVFECKDAQFQVTISQGLAEWPRHGKTAEALIEAADKALYDAKDAGRNCIRCAGD